MEYEDKDEDIWKLTEELHKNEVVVKIPHLWKRDVLSNGQVYYITPSGRVLISYEDVLNYLNEPTSCKCHLDEDLNFFEVFNFNSKHKTEQLTTQESSLSLCEDWAQSIGQDFFRCQMLLAAKHLMNENLYDFKEAYRVLQEKKNLEVERDSSNLTSRNIEINPQKYQKWLNSFDWTKVFVTKDGLLVNHKLNSQQLKHLTYEFTVSGVISNDFTTPDEVSCDNTQSTSSDGENSSMENVQLPNNTPYNAEIDVNMIRQICYDKSSCICSSDSIYACPSDLDNDSQSSASPLQSPLSLTPSTSLNPPVSCHPTRLIIVPEQSGSTPNSSKPKQLLLELQINNLNSVSLSNSNSTRSFKVQINLPLNMLQNQGNSTNDIIPANIYQQIKSITFDRNFIKYIENLQRNQNTSTGDNADDSSINIPNQGMNEKVIKEDSKVNIAPMTESKSILENKLPVCTVVSQQQGVDTNLDNNDLSIKNIDQIIIEQTENVENTEKNDLLEDNFHHSSDTDKPKNINKSEIKLEEIDLSQILTNKQPKSALQLLYDIEKSDINLINDTNKDKHQLNEEVKIESCEVKESTLESPTHEINNLKQSSIMNEDSNLSLSSTTSSASSITNSDTIKSSITSLDSNDDSISNIFISVDGESPSTTKVEETKSMKRFRRQSSGLIGKKGRSLFYDSTKQNGSHHMIDFDDNVTLAELKSRERYYKRLKRLRRELEIQGMPGNESEEEKVCLSPPLPPQDRVFNVGDIVWGQRGDVRYWPGKLVTLDEKNDQEDNVQAQKEKLIVRWFGVDDISMVSPENLKTLTEGLEAHHCARKRHRSGKRVNVSLEQAIQEAMMELDNNR